MGIGEVFAYAKKARYERAILNRFKKS
jgi:hypothetical protein